MLCPKCKKDVKPKHLHDTAHGLSMTHMTGSERYKCLECNHEVYKAEGILLGLKFILD